MINEKTVIFKKDNIYKRPKTEADKKRLRAAGFVEWVNGKPVLENKTMEQLLESNKKLEAELARKNEEIGKLTEEVGKLTEENGKLGEITTDVDSTPADAGAGSKTKK